MLFWFRNWMRRRRAKAERLIYPYFDGRQIRYGDPFALWRGIVNHKDLNMETMLEAVDEGQEPETTIAIDAITDVFGIVRLDSQTGDGLTDGQVLDILLDISNYFNELKKKSSPGPTLSSPTVSAFSTAQEPPSETTNSQSDSMLASSEPKPAEPSARCEP